MEDIMKEKGILLVSFGTSHDTTREKTIDALEQDIKEKYPEYKVYSAFTSSIIRRILSKREIDIDDVGTALAKMVGAGIKEVKILPTHLLYGEEYDKLVSEAKEYSSKVSSMEIAKPLLACTQDIMDVANILNKNILVERDECIVLMGHGTSHFCNTVYPAMDYICKCMELNHMFVGTVEAFPSVDDVLKIVKKSSFTKVILTPLMLVAGDHAVNDMASDEPDSWKSLFIKEGFEVRTLLKGLGEYGEIRSMYEDHLEQIM